jgi:hypothetical protein
MTQTFQIETVVSSSHILTIRGIPFRAGERVKVIIVSLPKSQNGERYPLHGKAVHFVSPYDSVAESDWTALKCRP